MGSPTEVQPAMQMNTLMTMMEHIININTNMNVSTSLFLLVICCRYVIMCVRQGSALLYTTKCTTSVGETTISFHNTAFVNCQENCFVARTRAHVDHN